MTNEKAQKAAEYRRKYEQNRITKGVSFHKEREADLLTAIENIDFSQWVKDVIREKLLK